MISANTVFPDEYRDFVFRRGWSEISGHSNTLYATVNGPRLALVVVSIPLGT